MANYNPSMQQAISPAIDRVLAHNLGYAETYSKAGMSPAPSRGLAVVGCMDARINPITSLGLEYGESHILRNAGAVVTPDVHRSLIISTQKFGTREIMIIGHTKCGLLNFPEAEFVAELEVQHGPSPAAPRAFCSFTDLEDNVHRQLRIIHDCPWIHPDAVARGFIFDVDTGLLAEVK